MEEVLKPDLCVIGAGSGGLSVAAAAAQFGVLAGNVAAARRLWTLSEQLTVVEFPL